MNLKNLVLSALILMAGLAPACAAPPATTPPAAAVKAEVVINMRQKLPKEVSLTNGQTLKLDNTGAQVKVQITDGIKGELLKSIPSGCGLCKAFTAERPGHGELIITERNGVVRKIKVMIYYPVRPAR